MNARREFLKKMLAIAAVPSVLALTGKAFAQEKKKKGAAGAAAGGKVDVNDPTAKALGYVEKSTIAGKNCANCILYQACGKPQGPCQVLPGKGDVLAAGYCNSWNAHPTCKA